MSTIVTRAGKGSVLTHAEVDANFTNLNADKLEAASIANMLETSDIGVSVQAYSANLTEYAAVNPSAAGLELLDDADAAAQRTTLGLVIGTDVQAFNSNIPTVIVSQVDAEAGTATDSRVWTAERVAQAIDAQAPQKKVTATAITTTSGTSIDFTSIPSWVKRITMGLVGVGTNGTSVPVIRIGDSGGYESTNYLGAVSVFQNGLACTVAALSSGCALAASWGSTLLIYGEISFQKIDGNTWAFSGSFGTTGSINGSSVSGTKELSATLDRIQLTTVNGTDAFDAGLVNISYE